MTMIGCLHMCGGPVRHSGANRVIDIRDSCPKLEKIFKDVYKRQTVISPNRWHFSGKEDQSFLGAGIPLLDFGARMYNPAIARWTTADPLSAKYYGISPYAVSYTHLDVYKRQSYSYSYGPSAGGNRIRARDYLSADAASFKETNTYHLSLIHI